jgi:hypothetical protein
MPVPNLIAGTYFGRSEMYSNANIWADAYANMGVLGMLVITILFWIIINVIDNLSLHRNRYLIYALIAMPSLSLTNSALLTTMLTHGLLLAMCIILLLPKINSTDI